MDDLYRLLDIDRDLVAEFLIVFSRFEYALKRTERYAKSDNNGVEANWDRFAEDHNAEFSSDKDSELKLSVEYLLFHPPKKQILRGGKLGWKTVCPQNVPTLQKLLLSVRRVRNNLFHGGKFPVPDGPVQEPGRDAQLLRSCKRVLLECLALNSDVMMYFRSQE